MSARPVEPPPPQWKSRIDGGPHSRREQRERDSPPRQPVDDVHVDFSFGSFSDISGIIAGSRFRRDRNATPLPESTRSALSAWSNEPPAHQNGRSRAHRISLSRHVRRPNSWSPGQLISWTTCFLPSSFTWRNGQPSASGPPHPHVHVLGLDPSARDSWTRPQIISFYLSLSLTHFFGGGEGEFEGVYGWIKTAGVRRLINGF